MNKYITTSWNDWGMDSQLTKSMVLYEFDENWIVDISKEVEIWF